MIKPLSAVIALFCCACIIKVGPGPDKFEPAQTGSGVEAKIALSSRALQGELLAIGDTALVLLTTDRVLLVPYSAITTSAFEHTPATVTKTFPLNADTRRVLGLLSRYPQGIPEPALARLLKSKSQDSLMVVR